MHFIKEICFSPHTNPINEGKVPEPFNATNLNPDSNIKLITGDECIIKCMNKTNGQKQEKAENMMDEEIMFSVLPVIYQT